MAEIKEITSEDVDDIISIFGGKTPEKVENQAEIAKIQALYEENSSKNDRFEVR